jgi:hypothetical protein
VTVQDQILTGLRGGFRRGGDVWRQRMRTTGGWLLVLWIVLVCLSYAYQMLMPLLSAR